jgi:TRAP-type mannitol/chloroaromatic compound transport system permease large subunit
MRPRADDRVFRLKGVCPPQVGLMDICKGIVSFIITQRIGFMIVVGFPKTFAWCRP